MMRWLERIVIGLWLIVTLGALTQQYRLWFQRERVLYAGKSIAEQREAVARRSGFRADVLDVAETAARVWPPDVSYEVGRDRGDTSYAAYILSPRHPVSHADRSLDDVATASPVASPQVPRAAGWGLLFSVLACYGAGKLLLAGNARGLAPPEVLGLGMGGLALTLISTRGLGLGTAGFQVLLWASVAAGGSWALLETSRALRGRLSERGAADWKPWGLVLLIGLVALWAFLMAVVVVPDDWDAWAIWGPKGKVLLDDTVALGRVRAFGHADYPLLWPAMWAINGFLSGGWEEQWVKGWGALLMLLTAWEAAGLLRDRGVSLGQALLAPAVLLSMPMLPLVASWGYAEASLWFFSLSALRQACRYQALRSTRALLWAGVFAAFAAHTKNEGVLLAVLLGVWLLPMARLRVWRYALPLLLLYGAWWILVRMGWQLDSHATVGFQAENILRAVRRIPDSLEYIWKMWLEYTRWNLVLLPALGFGLLKLLRSFRQASALLVPFGMLFIYWVIILFEPAELSWQVGTSWDRLTLQAAVLLIPLLWIPTAKPPAASKTEE